MQLFARKVYARSRPVQVSRDPSASFAHVAELYRCSTAMWLTMWRYVDSWFSLTDYLERSKPLFGDGLQRRLQRLHGSGILRSPGENRRLKFSLLINVAQTS